MVQHLLYTTTLHETPRHERRGVTFAFVVGMPPSEEVDFIASKANNFSKSRCPQVTLIQCWRNFASFPGGSQSGVQESLAQAATREFKEETGLDVTFDEVDHLVSTMKVRGRNGRTTNSASKQLRFHIFGKAVPMSVYKGYFEIENMLETAPQLVAGRGETFGVISYPIYWETKRDWEAVGINRGFADFLAANALVGATNHRAHPGMTLSGELKNILTGLALVKHSTGEYAFGVDTIQTLSTLVDESLKVRFEAMGMAYCGGREVFKEHGEFVLDLRSSPDTTKEKEEYDGEMFTPRPMVVGGAGGGGGFRGGNNSNDNVSMGGGEGSMGRSYAPTWRGAHSSRRGGRGRRGGGGYLRQPTTQRFSGAPPAAN